MWFGWFYLLSPCAALLPLLPGGPARHCVPRPSAAWHSLPDTMQQLSLHACASELRAAAGRCPCGPGLQRPSPRAEGTPWPNWPCLYTLGGLGGKKVWLVGARERPWALRVRSVSSRWLWLCVVVSLVASVDALGLVVQLFLVYEA